jgi:hypothetical protein
VAAEHEVLVPLKPTPRGGFTGAYVNGHTIVVGGEQMEDEARTRLSGSCH